MYDEVMEPVGLKMTQFAILATIFRDKEPTMQLLAAELGLDPSTMTRTLRPLTDGGLVQIQPGEDGDRRVKRLALTSLGRHKLGQGKKHWEAAQQQLSDRVGPEVFDRLIGDLSAVTKALRD
jgi:DNA-binding MarR family transcriptional regulator